MPSVLNHYCNKAVGAGGPMPIGYRTKGRHADYEPADTLAEQLELASTVNVQPWSTGPLADKVRSAKATEAKLQRMVDAALARVFRAEFGEPADDDD